MKNLMVKQTVSYLHPLSSSNQFEQALCDLAKMLGLISERHDVNGEGPDVLWLLPNKTGFIIEAKSRKKENNALTKVEHGQLLVAAEWFANNYPDYTGIRVSVHPKNHATKAAVADASHALTYENLDKLVIASRALLTTLCESQLSSKDLVVECDRLLSEYNVKYDQLSAKYLVPFEEVE